LVSRVKVESMIRNKTLKSELNPISASENSDILSYVLFQKRRV
jgi:hypothetical protein